MVGGWATVEDEQLRGLAAARALVRARVRVRAPAHAPAPTPARCAQHQGRHTLVHAGPLQRSQTRGFAPAPRVCARPCAAQPGPGGGGWRISAVSRERRVTKNVNNEHVPLLSNNIMAPAAGAAHANHRLPSAEPHWAQACGCFLCWNLLTDRSCLYETISLCRSSSSGMRAERIS